MENLQQSNFIRFNTINDNKSYEFDATQISIFTEFHDVYRNQSCDIAPKKAAAFDLTLDRFCWVVDCTGAAELVAFNGDDFTYGKSNFEFNT